jgi:uncharacterized protein (DUF2141 family)
VSSQAFAADLTVHITGTRAPEGSVVLALYDSAASFPKPGAQLHPRVVQVTQGALSVVFRDLPTGRYALVAFHDANGNGSLDRNLLGLPTEAFGFSNGAMGVASSPAFDKAAVALSADMALTLALH